MIEYCPSDGPTLGVEWEIALVDRETLDLVPLAESVVPSPMMPHGDDLHEPLLLEQAIPDVVPERLGADMTQPEAADGWLVRVGGDPVQGDLDRVEAAVRLMRNVLVVVRLDVSEVSLRVGEESDGVAHAVRRVRRRAFHSSSVM